LTRFDIKNSLKMNSAAIVLFLLCVFQIIYRIISIIFKIIYNKVIYYMQFVLLTMSIISILFVFLKQFII
jgi:hypothetical protein